SLSEENFCRSYITSDKTPNNALFQNMERVVHTSLFKGTDPYGKMTWIFKHDGGIEGMANDLKKMLSVDFKAHLNRDLYQGERREEPISKLPVQPIFGTEILPKQEEERPSPPPSSTEIHGQVRQLSLFDALDSTESSTAPAQKAASSLN